MTAREYLSQAFHLDQRINSKLEQLQALNELATKCTSVVTNMPHNPNCATSKVEETVAKIVDLQTEISKDAQRLVELKCEIASAIHAVENKEYQTLLEKRFLCGKTWETIAMEMGYCLAHLYRIKDKAYAKIKVPKDESK